MFKKVPGQPLFAGWFSIWNNSLWRYKQLKSVEYQRHLATIFICTCGRLSLARWVYLWPQTHSIGTSVQGIKFSSVCFLPSAHLEPILAIFLAVAHYYLARQFKMFQKTFEIWGSIQTFISKLAHFILFQMNTQQISLLFFRKMAQNSIHNFFTFIESYHISFFKGTITLYISPLVTKMKV